MQPSLRQPKQMHPKALFHLLRGACGMAGIFSQQDRHPPTSVSIMQISETCLKVTPSVMWPAKKEPTARPNIEKRMNFFTIQGQKQTRELRICNLLCHPMGSFMRSTTQ